MNADWEAIKACLRTVAALLLGNSLIVPIISNGQNSHWWILFLIGAMLLITTSVKLGKRNPK